MDPSDELAESKQHIRNYQLSDYKILADHQLAFLRFTELRRKINNHLLILGLNSVNPKNFINFLENFNYFLQFLIYAKQKCRKKIKPSFLPLQVDTHLKKRNSRSKNSRFEDGKENCESDPMQLNKPNAIILLKCK